MAYSLRHVIEYQNETIEVELGQEEDQTIGTKVKNEWRGGFSRRSLGLGDAWTLFLLSLMNDLGVL